MASGKRPALGRGLAALVDPAGSAAPGMRELPLERIRPNALQPREAFDREALEELAASIARDGLIQPLVVRDAGDGGFELIAGERRWRAARLAGLERVPVVVRDADEQASLLLALVENVVREDLNAIEVARGYARLADEFGLTTVQVAERVGKNRVTVANTLRLLELPDDVQTAIRDGQLTEGHGRALLLAPDHDRRRLLARRAIDERLSVRQLEEQARAASSTPARSRARRTRPGWLDDAVAGDLVDAAYRALGVAIRVTPTASGCRVELPIGTHAELARLLEALEDAAQRRG